MRTLPAMLGVLLTAWALAGCEQAQPDPGPSAGPEMTSRPAPTTQPTTRPAGTGEVIATVQGEPIYMDRLQAILVEDYGLAVARNLIALELVQQAAETKGISISDKDVQQEHERTLASMFASANSLQQRERLLDQLMQQNRLSRNQWRLIMERNALLRKVVADSVTVSDQEVNEEFGRRYGRKWIVRHIQVPTLADAQEAIKKAKAPGMDFGALARQMSTNPDRANGGLIGAVTAKSTNLPAAVVQAATAMQKPGEVSDPIQVGNTFHVLHLDRIEEPTDVDKADVVDQIRADIADNKSRLIQKQTLQRMIQDAQKNGQIRYVHPILKGADRRATESAERNQ